MAPLQLTPRPLAEIVQWLLQQHQQQRSVHNCPNYTPAAPQLLAATESLRDRWHDDTATLESLRELTTLDLSACEISSFERCSGNKERWASDKLSILLDCMPQLTLLDLRNSHKFNWQASEEKYRNEICDAGLLEAIRKLTSLQVLRVGAVFEGKAPDRRAAGREVLAVLAGALKGLTRLTELKLTVRESEAVDAFEEGGEELFGAIAGLPALRILHMNVRWIGNIKAHSPAVATSLAGALSGLKELADLNLEHHKFCLAGATSLANALQSLSGLTHLTTGVLDKLPAGIGGLTGLRTIGLSGCESLEKLPAALGALTMLQEIDLRKCSSLKELPAELGALKELQKINLSRCTSLKELPAVLGGLTALREIDLSYCKSLKELPAELGGLKELQKINLRGCKSLETLFAVLGGLTALREIDLSGCSSLKELPAELGALKELQKINLSGCESLEKLPAWIGGLTALRGIDLSHCGSLKELPAELGALTQIHKIDLSSCYALHTPPPHVVRQGTGAVLQFLRDLAKGDAPCHLIKVVLLGNQRAGKSSLADSLVLGRPVTRADSDRTVGIEVRRWPVGRESQLVVNIYDAAGQRVYRATHGLFMSAGALFLHVVRSDMPEDEAVETLLEWVEVVQQEAPGAVMGVVWTHIDCASATVSKSRVLGRVHGEITEQMRALDDVMREMEDVLTDHLQDRGAEQGGCLCEEWMRAREHRDAALKALDQRAMAGCTAEDAVVRAREQRDAALKALGQSEISDMAEALASVVAHQHAMQVLEDQLSMPQSVGDGEPFGEQLKRLRHKRLHRPRMLFSSSVSSRTGEGLDELRHALTALVENQRLFPHVGAKVPLNYSMLERLAQEGRTQASWGTEAYPQPDADLSQEGNKFRDNCIHVKTSEGNKFLEFTWAHFGTRSPIAHVTAVLCDPERADRELINAEQLNKKVVVAKGGGGTFVEKAQRAQQAGALALIIINTDNTLMTPGGEDSAVTIPVILVTADAGATLLQDGSHVTVGYATDRAAWEMAVTMHVKERASDGLRNVCKRPYVRLGELEEEASKVGMDKDEVLRALKFLHAVGSVLYYGSDTHHSSPELQNTVFMQPQFIIDAISYVIREPSADNVNDKVRKNDARIRERSDDGHEALDRYLGCKEGHGAGELSKQLLRHLWRDIDPQDHRVLVQLMVAFNLLRPLQSVDGEKYLVPAMLVTDKLPLEYVEPEWWCPSFASDVAEMSVDDTSKRAEMRIIYQVLGGRLPFGFMSELQVSLAQAESVQEGRHYAPETAVVDRLCGSVLSAAYKCGGGRVREWVIVSRDQMVQEQANTEAPVPASDCIRIMGWVSLDSDKGSTDWRLFRRVTTKIEDMRQRASGLCLKKMVFYVDAEGRQSKYLHVTAALASRELLPLEFDGGAKQDIDPDLLLPGASGIKLIKTKQHRLKEAADRHIDAFFAKQVDDRGIDVHGEGQALMRICLNAESTWTCNVHPQPTLADLHSSIAQTRQRNVRVLHLSGHAREECGFIWNANDAATAHKTFDIEETSEAIGKVAGEKGPVACVVLNACSTEKMGRLLRKQGVPCVLCWITPVQDETARELVDEFYPPLVEDKSGSRGYKEAFLAAVKKMGGEDAGGADTTVSGESRRPSTTTRNASPDASSTRLERESAKDQGYGNPSQGGPVRPCELDVVLFLSEDGDIGPFSLWRERPAAGQASPAEEAVDPELKKLFVDKGLGSLCAAVCRELNVKCVDDLEARARGMQKQNLVFDMQFLNNELPKYIKEKLTLGQKLDLVSIIEGERPVGGGQTSGPAASTNVATIRESRPVMAPAAHANLPRIEGFFVKIQPDKNLILRTIESVKKADDSDKNEKLKELESLVYDIKDIDPVKEEQELKSLLQKSNKHLEFEVSFHPRPTFKIFSDCMRTAAERKVCHLLFSGHGQSQWGFFWLKEGALEYEKIPIEHFLGLFETEVAGAYGRGTIEGVVLNACNTEDLGKKLIDAGVPHVVCWRSEVYDSTASAFSREFYTSFEQIKNYKICFQQAVSRIFPGKGGKSSHKKQKRLYPFAVDYVCLLSRDGENEFPDTGFIRGRVGVGDSEDDGDVVPNWRPPFAHAHALPTAAIQDDAEECFNNDGSAGATLVEAWKFFEDAEAVEATTADWAGARDGDGATIDDSEAYIGGVIGEEEPIRNWRDPTGKDDHSAQAGKCERDALTSLKFETKVCGKIVQGGNGIVAGNGFLSSEVLAQWGICKYEELWGARGKAVIKAQGLVAHRDILQKVVKSLNDALLQRKEDMKKRERRRKCKGTCPPRSCRECAMKSTHEHMGRLIRASKEEIESLLSSAATRSAPGPEPLHAPHEEEGGVLIESGFSQTAMELQAKDAAAEISRIRQETEMQRVSRVQGDAQESFNDQHPFEDAEAVTAKTAVIRVRKEKIESLISSAATRSAREPPWALSTRAPTTLESVTDRAEVAAEEEVDPKLKALFDKNGLGALCADVCRGLGGVKCLEDLKLVTAQDLDDELPKYVNLPPIQKRKLAAMIEGQEKGGRNIVIPFVGILALIGVLVAVQMIKRK